MLIMSKSLSDPMKGLPERASLPATTRNGRLNNVCISRSQLLTRPAGGTISTRWINRRANISRMYRPAMIVLPAPASSASKKAQAWLSQHGIVNGDTLVGQRVNAGGFGGKGRVEQMAVSQAFPFGHHAHDLGWG